MLLTIATHAAAFYAGGACLAYFAVGGSGRNRIVSALLWPSFPWWPL